MSRIVSLFIASSLDGYIARQDGGIDWLFTDADYGYKDFYASVDAVLVGRKTYDQSLTLEEHPFKGKIAYVFSRSSRATVREQTRYVHSDPAEFTRSLKKAPGAAGKIWLVGGGEIIKLLLREGLIDEIALSIHPIILGEGLPLFLPQPIESRWQTESCEKFPSGLVQIVYRKQPR